MFTEKWETQSLEEYVTSTDKPLKPYWLNENNKKKVFTKFSYQSMWGLINL